MPGRIIRWSLSKKEEDRNSENSGGDLERLRDKGNQNNRFLTRESFR